MTEKPGPASHPPASDTRPAAASAELPVVGAGTHGLSSPALLPSDRPAPRTVERGVVLFDLDGTLLDDLGRISEVAASVLEEAFGTPPDEGRVHYLATTGMPFEAQLAQLYPDTPVALRAQTARRFHQRKTAEAYAHAEPFPEVPKLLKRLAQERWTLAVSTGAEREMAELLLEREGIRYWFDAVLGSADGTKREHLVEYRRRYPDAPMVLVGDSRFDMEAAASLPGVLAVGRASRLPFWTLSPKDLRGWGAAWADYNLAELPEVLERLVASGSESKQAKSAAKPRRRRTS